jgi:hypothetical protein
VENDLEMGPVMHSTVLMKASFSLTCPHGLTAPADHHPSVAVVGCWQAAGSDSSIATDIYVRGIDEILGCSDAVAGQ